MRPAGIRCDTCPYWADGEDPELRLGECRRRAPETSEQRVAGLRAVGQEALRRFVDDAETSEAAAAEVMAWFKANERRLPAHQPRIRIATWHPTHAEHWCGEHPRWSDDP